MNTLHDRILPLLRDLAAQSAKASVLACMVALLCFLPRRWLPSGWRHALWCMVFVRLVLPDVSVPGWSWNVNRLLPEVIAPQEQKPEAVVIADEPSIALSAPSTADHSSLSVPTSSEPPSSDDVKMTKAATVAPQVSSSQTSSYSWWSVLGILWLAGAIVWWLALLTAWWRFRRRVLARSFDATFRSQALLMSCLRETGVRPRVRLQCSAHISTPAVCGVIRPVMLIPQALESKLPMHELRLLLLHELGHVKRRDTLVQVFASVLLGLHWWNPVLWFAWSRLRHEAETATDAWVLRRTGPHAAPTYGAMLLDLASRACAVGVSLLLVPSLIGATSQGRRLRQRLTAITGYRPAKRWAGAWGVALLVALAIAGFSQEAPAPKSMVPPASTTSDRPSPTSAIGGLIVDEQGQPIQGAKIEIYFTHAKDYLVKSVLPDGAKKPETVESGADGRWHLDGVPVGVVPATAQTVEGKDTYRLYITHPDFLLEESAGAGPESGNDTTFRQQTMKFVLKRGHVMRGVVRDEQGKGIAGATIERNIALRYRADPKATTDAEGKYELKAARHGDFVVRVRAEGYALQQQHIVLSADQTADFVLKPAKTLTLKFRDEKGQPLTKGYVNLMPTAKPWQDADRLLYAQPDQEGNVIWKEAPAGNVIAVVHMDGFLRMDKEVTVGGEVVLTPPAKHQLPQITLHVTSATTGKPLPGCTISTGLVLRKLSDPPRPFWLGGEDHAAMKPGAAEGEYSAHVSEYDLKELLMFRVRCEGYAPVLTALVDSQKGNTTITVPLQERQPTPITVLKEDGSPAPNAAVYVVWNSWFKMSADPAAATGNMARLPAFMGKSQPLEFFGVTGADGRCVLPACADDASVLAVTETGFTTAGYADLMKNGIMKIQAYRVGEEKLVKTMTPRTSGPPQFAPLHVTVMRDGKPLAKDRIFMLTTTGESDSVPSLFPNTVTQGFARWGFPSGSRLLQVAFRGPEGSYDFSPAVATELKLGEAVEVTAQLEPGIRLAGRVADDMPRPIKDARIYVYVSPVDQGPLAKLTWSDWKPLHEDGTFEFPSLPKGQVRFFVLSGEWMSPIAPEGGDKNRPWSAGLISQSRSDLVIPMQRTSACDVTVLDAQGNAVPGAVLTISAPFTADGVRSSMLVFDGSRGHFMFDYSTLEDSFALKTHRLEKDFLDSLRVRADAQGHAVIHGLPSLALLGRLNVNTPEHEAQKAQFHGPSAFTAVESIKPGETAKLTVHLEK